MKRMLVIITTLALLSLSHAVTAETESSKQKAERGQRGQAAERGGEAQRDAAAERGRSPKSEHPSKADIQARRATRQMEQMIEILDLSEEQQAALKSSLAESQEKMAAANSREQRVEAMRDLRRAMRGVHKEILTEEQRDLWVAHVRQQREEMRERRSARAGEARAFKDRRGSMHERHAQALEAAEMQREKMRQRRDDARQSADQKRAKQAAPRSGDADATDNDDG